MTYGILLGSIVFALGAGALGSRYTIKEIPGWYAGLVRPKLSPPNWVFGPVWTTLYVLMGFASWLVFEAGIDRGDVQLALGVYVVQLALNALWSYLFFGKHQLRVAFYELCALWLSIALTIYLFWGIAPLAALFLVPYLAWVTFAGTLNYRFSVLNP